MLLWALAAVVTLLIAVPLPFLHDTLKLQAISLSQWGLVIVAAFVATFWMEAVKVLLTKMPGETEAGYQPTSRVTLMRLSSFGSPREE